MGSHAQRLLAVLLGFALAMLARPSELHAKHGPSAVHVDAGQGVVLQAPKRPLAAPGLAQLNPDDGHCPIDVGELSVGWVVAPAVARACAGTDAQQGRERQRRLARLRTRGPPVR